MRHPICGCLSSRGCCIRQVHIAFNMLWIIIQIFFLKVICFFFFEENTCLGTDIKMYNAYVCLYRVHSAPKNPTITLLYMTARS